MAECGSPYLLLAVSAEQDEKHEQQDDAQAHDEDGEVGHKSHDEEQWPHLGCWLIVNSRRLELWKMTVLTKQFTRG